MTDEKQQKIDQIIEEKKSPWQSLVRILVILIILVCGLLAGLIATLQLGTYAYVEERKTPEQLLNEVAGHLSYGSDGILVPVPESVLNSELKSLLEKEITNSNISIYNTHYDGVDGRFYVNLSYRGFYVPISYALSFEQVNDDYTICLSEPELTKFNWSAELIKVGLESWIGIDQKTWPLDVYAYGVNDYLELKSVERVRENLVLKFDIDRERVSGIVNQIRSSVDPILLDHYKSYSQERIKPVLDILEGSGPLTDSQFQSLVTSALGDQYLLNDLLLVTRNFEGGELTGLLEDYGLTLDLETIARQRYIFKGQTIDPIITQVFVALDTHFGDGMMAFNQGKPFDIERMETMTVQRLIDFYELDISEEDAKAMTFIYDDAFKVAYKMAEDAYYIRGIDGFEVIGQAAYLAMLGSQPFVEPIYVTDKDLWFKVTDFAKAYLEAERIYVRYMKSDGRSIFAVVSSDLDPQDYWSMALMIDNGQVALLEENVTSVPALISAHPEFNVETATREVERISFKRIGADIHDLIVEEMEQQRFIPRNSDITIDYSSFDGSKYIAFMLSDGNEYVYTVENTVYGTYLATVYTKDKAMSNWTGIPELLLLQDLPE